MRNCEFVFTPKIEYKLVAERSEANQNSLTFPVWCRGRESVTSTKLFIRFAHKNLSTRDPASATSRRFATLVYRLRPSILPLWCATTKSLFPQRFYVLHVPRERIELSWITPHDFESCASANSATAANHLYKLH